MKLWLHDLILAAVGASLDKTSYVLFCLAQKVIFESSLSILQKEFAFLQSEMLQSYS